MNFHITIVFEDDQILAINKPAGHVVNTSDTTKGGVTIQDWAETKLKVQSAKFKVEEGSDFYNRAGIVHRLDKETSGILLIAKTPETFAKLQRQFKERIVKKTYIALVHGEVIGQVGEIRVPVGRLPWNRKQFGVVAGGREAVTRYKILRYYDTKILRDGKFTLLELYPETGRTHQIRVHLKYIGHPIVSDELYAGRKTAKKDRKVLARIFLHAAKISFLHPKSGKMISLQSPLPHDLQKVLDQLSK